MEPIHRDFSSETVHVDPKQEMVEAILKVCLGKEFNINTMANEFLDTLKETRSQQSQPSQKSQQHPSPPSPLSPPSPVSPIRKSIPINKSENPTSFDQIFQTRKKDQPQNRQTIHRFPYDDIKLPDKSIPEQVFRYNDLSVSDLVERLERQQEKMEEILMEMQIIRRKLSKISVA